MTTLRTICISYKRCRRNLQLAADLPASVVVSRHMPAPQLCSVMVLAFGRLSWLVRMVRIRGEQTFSPWLDVCVPSTRPAAGFRMRVSHGHHQWIGLRIFFTSHFSLPTLPPWFSPFAEVLRGTAVTVISERLARAARRGVVLRRRRRTRERKSAELTRGRR